MKVCSSRKVRHRTAKDAEVGAHVFARQLNAAGRLVQDLYAYRCPECSHFHLSRAKTFAGVPNTLVFTAPPEELQRWAMPPERGEMAL